MRLKETPSETPTRERKLGFYERFRVSLHDLGYYNNISIIARYRNAAKILESWPQAVFHAFSHAIQIHPELSTTVTKDADRTLYFQRLPTVNLEELITFQTLSSAEDTDSKLLDLSAAENNRGYGKDPSKPLWRAVAIRYTNSDSFRIAFIWHHVIGDGKSGLAVHQTLLQGFSTLPTDLDCKSNRPTTQDFTRVPSSTKPPFISVDDALPNSTASSPVPPLQGEKWAGKNHTDKPPVTTQLGHIRVAAVTVQRILSGCRKNGTTMTPLLQAIVAKALLDNVSQPRIRTAVAVSLRRFFDPALAIDDSVMGLWISTYTTEYLKSHFTSDASSLWKISKENTAQINDLILDGGRHVELMVLKGVEDYDSAVKAKMGQPRDNSCGVTNIGLFRNEKNSEGRVEVDDMLFSQSCHANGAAFTVCAVTVDGGDMNMVFNWQEGIVGREEMERVTAGVKGLIDKIVDGE